MYSGILQLKSTTDDIKEVAAVSDYFQMSGLKESLDQKFKDQVDAGTNLIIDNSASHSSILQYRMKEMLEQSVFMDCHLEAEGKKIAFHRLVLGAYSPVLQAMLTSGMKESQTSVIPIKLFSIEIMEAIVR